MPNVFYVQISNNPQPCKIQAEKITQEGQQNTNEGRLTFTDDKEQVVGSFRSSSVVGWWKQWE